MPIRPYFPNVEHHTHSQHQKECSACQYCGLVSDLNNLLVYPDSKAMLFESKILILISSYLTSSIMLLSKLLSDPGTNIAFGSSAGCCTESNNFVT